MAGPRARRNALPPAGEDELARDVPGASTEGSGILFPSPAASRAPTPATAQAPKARAHAPGKFVLHPVGKQAYKLELPRKWRIYDVFHVSLLEQDTTRKGRVDENDATELDAGDNKGGEYEMEAIRDSAVYAQESESGHLPGLYYLVSWKGYPDEENTWEPASAVQYLEKLIKSFHKDHPDKPTATSPGIDTVPPMARPTVKLTATKRKQGRRANSSNKRAKKN